MPWSPAHSQSCRTAAPACDHAILARPPRSRHGRPGAWPAAPQHRLCVMGGARAPSACVCAPGTNMFCANFILSRGTHLRLGSVPALWPRCCASRPCGNQVVLESVGWGCTQRPHTCTLCALAAAPAAAAAPTCTAAPVCCPPAQGPSPGPQAGTLAGCPRRS